MPTYERRTRVRAPLATVWAFHSTAGGLRALTPRWAGLSVDAVELPDDASGAGSNPWSVELVEGTRLHLSMRPFGFGPAGRWVSEITRSRATDSSASFQDVMNEGPLARWTHTHSFFSDGDGTVVLDRVEYGTGYGPLADALVRPGLDLAFRYRHRRTRALLE